MDIETESRQRAGDARQPIAPAEDVAAVPGAYATAASLAATALAACGGGGSSDDSGSAADVPPPPPPSSGPPMPTAAEASRFLAQASMGADRTQIAKVQAIGYAAWLDEQFALPAGTSRWDSLVAGGYNDPAYRNTEAGFDAVVWPRLLAAPDTLRQRVTLALSEIVVTSIGGVQGSGWKHFCAANYLDLLEASAFGNFRSMLQQVSTSTAMGIFLTYRGSAKANATTGALPDENYARELMQLFTIGLVELNLDGSVKLQAGAPIATYAQDDIAGLARVFTGWDFDLAGQTFGVASVTPEFMRRPLAQIAARHEPGTKAFLGTTIAANTDGVQSLALALDAIFAHANVAPFISKQLIQRLVSSNPSPAYVARVATVFKDDGTGVRGNLKAVVKAILLDADARSPGVAAGASAGKLREPVLRFAGWARGWSVTSPSGAWAIGNTSDPATRLGQSPLRSPSVFNFFRPGYVPPSTAIAAQALVAPEFQITNESSVVGAVNYLQRAVSGAVADLAPDYAPLVAIADDAAALVAEINLVLAADQMSTATVATIATAVATMAAGSDIARLKRIHASLTLTLAAPEFVVLK